MTDYIDEHTFSEADYAIQMHYVHGNQDIARWEEGVEELSQSFEFADFNIENLKRFIMGALEYKLPQEGGAPDFLSFCVALLNNENVSSELESSLLEIGKLIENNAFDTSQGCHDLYWSLVLFVYHFYNFVFESLLLDPPNAIKNALIILYPFKIGKALCYFIKQRVGCFNVLAFDGFSELGLLLSLIRHSINNLQGLKDMVGPYTIDLFDFVWTGFLSRFPVSAEKDQFKLKAFQENLFSFLVILGVESSILWPDSINQEDQNIKIMQEILEDIYFIAPQEIKDMLRSLGSGSLSLILIKFLQGNYNPDFWSLRLLSFENLEFRDLFKNLNCKHNIAFLAVILNRLFINLDPGKLMSIDNSIFTTLKSFKIPNYNFVICNLYNELFESFLDLDILEFRSGPFNLDPSIIAKKSVFLYFGSAAFYKLTKEARIQFPVWIDIFFSRFNCLTGKEKSYLERSGYVYWKTRELNASFKNRFNLIMGFFQSLISFIFIFKDKHLEGIIGREMAFVEGGFRDIDDTIPHVDFNKIVGMLGCDPNYLENIFSVFMYNPQGIENVNFDQFQEILIRGLLSIYGENIIGLNDDEVGFTSFYNECYKDVDCSKLTFDLNKAISTYFIKHKYPDFSELQTSADEFCYGFFNSFLNAAGIQLDPNPYLETPSGDFNWYIKHLDPGVVFDLNWGLFLRTIDPTNQADPFETFMSEIGNVHPISTSFIMDDTFFKTTYYRKRSLNDKLIYDIHRYVGSLGNKGPIFSKTNELEAQIMGETFEDVDDAQEIIPIDYERNWSLLIEKRRKWWTLIGFSMLSLMRDFFDELKEGKFRDLDLLKLKIEKTFEISNFIIDSCGNQPLIAPFRHFISVLTLNYNYIKDREDSKIAYLAYYYYVSFYFQLRTAEAYMTFMISKKKLFGNVDSELHPELKFFQLVCCYNNFFPSFTSIQTSDQNVCSIFDPLLLISDQVPVLEGTFIRAQIFLAYIFDYSFVFGEDGRFHYRAFETVQVILLGGNRNSICVDVLHSVGERTTATWENSTPISFLGGDTIFNNWVFNELTQQYGCESDLFMLSLPFMFLDSYFATDCSQPITALFKQFIEREGGNPMLYFDRGWEENQEETANEEGEGQQQNPEG